MKPNYVNKLFKYYYTEYCQGTADRGWEYVLLHVPIDASFNNNRSTLYANRHKKNVHEVDINSVQDLTINF